MHLMHILYWFYCSYRIVWYKIHTSGCDLAAKSKLTTITYIVYFISRSSRKCIHIVWIIFQFNQNCKTVQNKIFLSPVFSSVCQPCLFNYRTFCVLLLAKVSVYILSVIHLAIPPLLNYQIVCVGITVGMSGRIFLSVVHLAIPLSVCLLNYQIVYVLLLAWVSLYILYILSVMHLLE
jgi:hypothetical protein